MKETAREARIPLVDAPEEGGVRMLEVGRHRVGLYRVAGDLHALADRCPHRGASLCAGRIGTTVEADGDLLRAGPQRSIVRCPWHKWEFDIASGRCLVDARLRVRRYRVCVDGDDVVVTLDHPA